MLQAIETSKQAKANHARSPAGRALLRLEQDVRDWIAENRAVARPATVEAAELLACNLYSAAHNGLGMGRAALLDAVDRTLALVRRQSGITRCTG